MENKQDDRFKNSGQPRTSETKPEATTSSTADNPSVYQQPTIQQATKDGKVDKMDDNCPEDRKHTS